MDQVLGLDWVHSLDSGGVKKSMRLIFIQTLSNILEDERVKRTEMGVPVRTLSESSVL